MPQELIKGFKEFHRETYEGDNPLMPLLVKEGQKPDYFIISCIDSRSNPGTIFKPKPGTFFAHKAMGAIVRPYREKDALSAALQFALNYNDVKKIIILGHTGCGAVKALVEELDDEEISGFIKVATKGLDKAKEKCADSCSHDELLREAEEQIVLQSAENLKTYPSVQKALKENRVAITPWLFDMEAGALLEYNNDQQKFTAITTDNGEGAKAVNG